MQFNYKVSTHSRPKAAGDAGWYHVLQFSVSTHSRPKAAGCLQPDAYSYWPCFNTQPPEGGWGERIISGRRLNSFNTQPPEGGWARYPDFADKSDAVSTHSRPKAAGCGRLPPYRVARVSTHSRPKAAGNADIVMDLSDLFQHTAARRRLASRLDHLQANE